MVERDKNYIFTGFDNGDIKSTDLFFGEIVGIKEYGVFVNFHNTLIGVSHIPEHIRENPEENPVLIYDLVNGEGIGVSIGSIDKENSRFNLTLEVT